MIITSASNLLCSGTPTVEFADIFSRFSEGGSSVSGATGMSDHFTSQTAVSSDFTPTGSQSAESKQWGEDDVKWSHEPGFGSLSEGKFESDELVRYWSSCAYRCH
ncbi:hypothetical protein D0Z07_5394 [Hyphodiscus hymeniophilus]|uniref:Uncharacterized protein n=1 Tax=Hyphodiscus hymeniophilus TaxID=353542 RepID=A0A9P6VIG2_9HELO|nr:hypothetical protein D0Z07_5394 [Hyphodiscus hymeniophilus]